MSDLNMAIMELTVNQTTHSLLLTPTGSFISFEFNEYGYWDDLGSFYAWEAGYHTFLPVS